MNHNSKCLKLHERLFRDQGSRSNDVVFSPVVEVDSKEITHENMTIINCHCLVLFTEKIRHLAKEKQLKKSTAPVFATKYILRSI